MIKFQRGQREMQESVLPTVLYLWVSMQYGGPLLSLFFVSIFVVLTPLEKKLHKMNDLKEHYDV